MKPKIPLLVSLILFSGCGSQTKDTNDSKKPTEATKTQPEKPASENAKPQKPAESQTSNSHTQQQLYFLGEWQSKTCEKFEDTNQGSIYHKRTMTFTDNRWEINILAYSDSKCSSELLTLKSKGTYILKNKSSFIQGADNIILQPSEHLATPANFLAAMLLNSSSVCGQTQWQAGKSINIYENGCKEINIPEGKSCPQEFHSIMHKNSELFHSIRNMESCNENNWPQELFHAGLTKK